MNEILVIGNLDSNPVVIGGQHTRTRNVTELLRRQFGEATLDLLDLSMPKARLFLLFFRKVFRCRQIVLLGGPQSLPIFLFLLLLCGKLPATTMVAIGGWLGDLANRNRLVRSVMLPRIAHVFVQTALIRDAVLRNVPGCRVSIMPNFSLHPKVLADDPDRFNRDLLRVLFLSRVCRSKGVYDAIDAVQELRGRGHAVTLDIYGSREDDAGEELTALLNSDIRYMGVVPHEQVIEVMTRYDVLVFPTFYKGEGFPAVIIEAFRSGTPVVCSDWKSNPEVVTDGQTGLIYSLCTRGALEAALLKLVRNRELLHRISIHARAEADKYEPAVVAAPFLNHVATCSKFRKRVSSVSK